MSENLDLVRSIYAAWGRGDYSATQWIDPEVEYVLTAGPEASIYRGLDELGSAMKLAFGDFAELHTEAEEYRELDHQRVLVFMRFTGRGKKSGVEFDHRGAELLELRDGKVTKIVVYHDRDRALADLGLEE